MEETHIGIVIQTFGILPILSRNFDSRYLHYMDHIFYSGVKSERTYTPLHSRNSKGGEKERELVPCL